MMATTSIPAQGNNSNYYLNPSAGPSPPEAFHFARRQPSTPPSQNISPTNYHANNVRQLRQPRQPLYVPAALRPNEKIARPTDIPARPRAPDTPPASNESSYDGPKLDSPMATDFARFQLAQSDSDHEALRRGLSRAASETLSLEEMGPVTGMPTTAHWKPDQSAKSCAVCQETFGWIFRRHHCRRCGNVVCYNHVRSIVPLDQNARLHPEGHPSKACDPCYDEYKIVKKLYHSRASSISESTNSSQGTAMPIPSHARQADDVRIGSMARSEGGMVWSTF